MAPDTPGHGPEIPFKPGPTAFENAMYDRYRTPRPASERGWTLVGYAGPDTKLGGIQFGGAEVFIGPGSKAQAVDATFENETRPHR